MQYVYPAIFYKDKKLPETYSVIFPDVSGAVTFGFSLYDAIFMAEDALNGILTGFEDGKISNKISEPTPIDKVVAKPDEFSESAFVTLIKADTDAYRKFLAENPPQETESDDDFEVPETYAREICKVAGIKYPFEAKS